MIERYECEDVAHIWSNSGKFGGRTVEKVMELRYKGDK